MPIISLEVMTTLIIGGPSLVVATLTWWESRKRHHEHQGPSHTIRSPNVHPRQTMEANSMLREDCEKPDCGAAEHDIETGAYRQQRSHNEATLPHFRVSGSPDAY
jgi:hypothetical protein